ncbi:AbrB family transcriptional regulator [Oricola sp.]|uniref:AbrB family transcriptional regulator n=1 Tax=Oricola sp. TaxID=1979950 RepID=UPI0025FB3334|nr:AbrB family transcriptional regulator [Oricola sp.]MCI5076750.1 AbrB family transcriptional regulator [Oricola sp.]
MTEAVPGPDTEKSSPVSPGRTWLRSAAALLIGVAGALVARQVMMPMPWLLGAMIATMVASVAGAPISAPVALRPLFVPVLGVMLGSGFSTAVFANAGSWLLTLALMPVYITCTGVVAYVYLRKVARYDRVTAFFSAMPGGINELLHMGEDAGGDGRVIGLSHATRILIVVLTVVLSYGFFLDVQVGGQRSFTSFSSLALSDVGWLLTCGVVGAVVAPRLRLPAALLTGPLICSAIAHTAGVVEVPPPTILSWAAQLVIGAIVGARFVGVSVAEIFRYLAVGIVATMLILVVSVIFAGIVSMFSPTEMAQSFLAFSPGGATEMSLLALAMGQDMVFISFAHIARVAMVVALTPIGFRLFRRFLA